MAPALLPPDPVSRSEPAPSPSLRIVLIELDDEAEGLTEVEGAAVMVGTIVA
jgi:hypothetical protein